MKSIVFKSILDGWKTVPAVFLLSLLYVLRSSFGHWPVMESDLFTSGSLLGGIYAMILAVALNWREQNQDARGWMLSQPVTRSSIYWGRLLGAAILYCIAFIPTGLTGYFYLAAYYPQSGPIYPNSILTVMLGIVVAFSFYPSGVWVLSRKANWFGSRTFPLLIPVVIYYTTFIALFVVSPSDPTSAFSLVSSAVTIAIAWAATFLGASYSFQHLSNSPSRLAINKANPLKTYTFITQGMYVVGMVSMCVTITFVAFLLCVSFVSFWFKPQEFRTGGITAIDKNNNLIVLHNNSGLNSSTPTDSENPSTITKWPPRSQSSMEQKKASESNSSNNDNESDVSDNATSDDSTKNWTVATTTYYNRHRGQQLWRNNFTYIGSLDASGVPNNSNSLTSSTPTWYQDYKGVLYAYQANPWGKSRNTYIAGRDGFGKVSNPFRPESISGYLPPAIRLTSMVGSPSVATLENAGSTTFTDGEGIYDMDFNKGTVRTLVQFTTYAEVIAYSRPTPQSSKEYLYAKSKGELSTYNVVRNNAESSGAIESIELVSTVKIDATADTSEPQQLYQYPGLPPKLLKIDFSKNQVYLFDFAQVPQTSDSLSPIYYDYKPRNELSSDSSDTVAGICLPPVANMMIYYYFANGNYPIRFLWSGIVFQIAASLGLTLWMSKRRMLNRVHSNIWLALAPLLGWVVPMSIAVVHPKVAKVTCKGCSKIIRADDEQCPYCDSGEIVSTIETRLADNLRIV